MDKMHILRLLLRLLFLCSCGFTQGAYGSKSCLELFFNEADNGDIIAISSSMPWTTQQNQTSEDPSLNQWNTRPFRRELFLLFAEQIFTRSKKYRPNLTYTPENKIFLEPHNGAMVQLDTPNFHPNRRFGILNEMDLKKAKVGDLVMFQVQLDSAVVTEIKETQHGRKIYLRKESGQQLKIEIDSSYQALRGRRFEVVIVTSARRQHFINIYDGVSSKNATEFPVLDKIVKMLALVPHEHVEAIEQIELVPSPNFKEFIWSIRNRVLTRPYAIATAHQGRSEEDRMAFYHNFFGRPFDEMGMTRTFLHEFAHLFAVSKFGSFDPPWEWIEATFKDGNFITSYAKSQIREDFAETVSYYLLLGNNPQLRKYFKHRFKLLDKYFDAK